METKAHIPDTLWILNETQCESKAKKEELSKGAGLRVGGGGELHRGGLRWTRVGKMAGGRMNMWTFTGAKVHGGRQALSFPGRGERAPTEAVAGLHFRTLEAKVRRPSGPSKKDPQSPVD